MTHNFGKFLVLVLVASTAFSSVTLFAKDDNEKPVRKLQKEAAQIVVDSTDQTTYYIQPKKLTKEEKKRLKQQEDSIKRVEAFKARQEEAYRKQCLASGKPYFTPAEREAKKAREKARLDSLLSLEYGVTPPEPEAKPLVWVDDPISETVEQLAPLCNITETQAVPKNVNFGQSTDEMFLYFDVENGKATKLHFRAQYYRDDPLDIQSMKFFINGFYYDLQPAEVKAGKSGKLFWETVDQVLTTQKEKDLSYALAHANWVRVIYVGKEFKHKIDLTKDKIKEMYNTLTLYRLMGGTF